MDCRHPGPQDATGYIHVDLGPGSPCRDDELTLQCYVTHINLMSIVLHLNQIFEGDRERYEELGFEKAQLDREKPR